MVVISVKQQDGECFLFETTTNTLNDHVIDSLVEIYNARIKARIIIETIKKLNTNQQVDDVDGTESINSVAVINVKDGHGTDLDSISTASNGEFQILSDPIINLNRSIDELEKYLCKTHTQSCAPTRLQLIEDKIDNVRGAILMVYPKGLPSSDTLLALNWDQLDQNEKDLKYENFALSSNMLVARETKLWCAGKEMMRGQKVSNLLGTNEKTKVICKLVKSSDGAPMREPVVNEKEREAMIHYYMKRQDELKRLAESEGIDDDYLNSDWADSKQMKRSLQGIDNIKVTGTNFM